MKAHIENYKGFNIYFDTVCEKFYVEDESFSKEKETSSYQAAKKFIDDYIQRNKNFKPFFVENLGGKKYKVVGIRKDGYFNTEDEQGRKERIHRYWESEYYLINEANEPIRAVIKELEAKKDEIDKQIKEQRNKMILVSLKDIKKNYL